MRRSTRRPGFTLIELLVVIAIIGVLVSILLPSLKGARENARRVACMAHLRGFGTALLMYQDHYGGRFPPADGRFDLPAGRTGFMGPLDSYLDAPMPFVDAAGEVRTQIPFRCPSDPDRGLPRGTSYDEFVSGMRLQHFDPFPWKHRMMADEFEWNGDLGLEPGWHGPGPNRERHNAVYVDGHCDWTAPPQGD